MAFVCRRSARRTALRRTIVSSGGNLICDHVVDRHWRVRPMTLNAKSVRAPAFFRPMTWNATTSGYFDPNAGHTAYVRSSHCVYTDCADQGPGPPPRQLAPPMRFSALPFLFASNLSPVRRRPRADRRCMPYRQIPQRTRTILLPSSPFIALHCFFISVGLQPTAVGSGKIVSVLAARTSRALHHTQQQSVRGLGWLLPDMVPLHGGLACVIPLLQFTIRRNFIKIVPSALRLSTDKPAQWARRALKRLRASFPLHLRIKYVLMGTSASHPTSSGAPRIGRRRSCGAHCED